MMDAPEFLRETELAIRGEKGGSEQGSCDPLLIKINWFDKRQTKKRGHSSNIEKKTYALI